MTTAVPDRDPGLQPERTRLAWRRTALTLTVTTVLGVRALVGHGLAVTIAGAAVAATAWIALLLMVRRRSRAIGATNRPGPPGAVVPVTALAVVGYALVGVVLLLLRGLG